LTHFETRKLKVAESIGSRPVGLVRRRGSSGSFENSTSGKRERSRRCWASMSLAVSWLMGRLSHLLGGFSRR
jgi:hypothetical protein